MRMRGGTTAAGQAGQASTRLLLQLRLQLPRPLLQPPYREVLVLQLLALLPELRQLLRHLGCLRLQLRGARGELEAGGEGGGGVRGLVQPLVQLQEGALSCLGPGGEMRVRQGAGEQAEKVLENDWHPGNSATRENTAAADLCGGCRNKVAACNSGTTRSLAHLVVRRSTSSWYALSSGATSRDSSGAARRRNSLVRSASALRLRTDASCALATASPCSSSLLRRPSRSNSVQGENGTAWWGGRKGFKSGGKGAAAACHSRLSKAAALSAHARDEEWAQ
jgi:hypothetical protein